MLFGTYSCWNLVAVLINKTQETQDYIFRTDYLKPQRPVAAVYEVPSYLTDWTLAADMLQFKNIVAALQENMQGERGFDLMENWLHSQ